MKTRIFNNRKVTRGRIRQTVMSEPRKILVKQIEKTTKSGEKIIKNVYKINHDAKPINVLAHRTS